MDRTDDSQMEVTDNDENEKHGAVTLYPENVPGSREKINSDISPKIDVNNEGGIQNQVDSGVDTSRTMEESEMKKRQNETLVISDAKNRTKSEQTENDCEMHHGQDEITKSSSDSIQVQVHSDMNIHEAIPDETNLSKGINVNSEMVPQSLNNNGTILPTKDENGTEPMITINGNNSVESLSKLSKGQVEVKSDTLSTNPNDIAREVETNAESMGTNLNSLKESLPKVGTTAGGLVPLVADYGSSHSDEESDSDDSSTSSSSSTSESDSDDIPQEQRRTEVKEQEGEQNNVPKPPKTKKELMLQDMPAVPYVDFRLGDNEEIILLGKVSSIIGLLVVVQSNTDTPALNEDTVLFKEDRHPIGVVFEIFGPVLNPFYTVRFNSSKDITDLELALNAHIYFAPKQEEITNYVFVKELQALKGSDASWTNDDEPPLECLDFSDDEDERKIRKKKALEIGKRKDARKREENESMQRQFQGGHNQQTNATVRGNPNGNQNHRGRSQRHYNQPPRAPFNGMGPSPMRPRNFPGPRYNGPHHQMHQGPQFFSNRPNFAPNFPPPRTDMHNPANQWHTPGPPPRNMYTDQHFEGRMSQPFPQMFPYSAPPPPFMPPGIPGPRGRPPPP